MSNVDVDVVIAGAGPNGLMVASELALAGVRSVVLERLAEPSAEPRANGLVGQVIRQLDMRGLYQQSTATSERPQPASGWLFSGMPLSFAEVADNPMHVLPIAQPRLVTLLAAHAQRLGVDIRWGHDVTDLAVWDGVATLKIAGPDANYDLRPKYVVGADGAHSVIRKSTGIAFPGHTAPTVVRMAHVRLPDELRAQDGGLDVPGFGRIGFGHNRFERGMVAFAELERGRPIVATMEFAADPVPDGVAMTLQELRDSAHRILGVDMPIDAPTGPGPHAMRRTDSQNTRLAERYRADNVLLVGDAAHIHSAMGGPGLNLGLADAINLGWKLAAVVNGWAPKDLLDTYQSERYPIAQRVMMHSLAQTALMAPGPEVTALRTLFSELLQVPQVATHMAHLLAGSDVRYDVENNHRLAGRLVPEFALSTGQRIAELLRNGRPLLLDFAGGPFAQAAEPWDDRVDLVTASHERGPAAGLLIRPDGYVAWATDSHDAHEIYELHHALHRWFGLGGDDVGAVDMRAAR
jgi:2-polyprenyl-6-methoxyphenol hydroxylase-like FAD-dependent oxidoreductase